MLPAVCPYRHTSNCCYIIDFSLHLIVHNKWLSATTISILQICMGALISNQLRQFLLHYIVQAVLLSPLPPLVCFQEGLLLDSCDEQCAFG